MNESTISSDSNMRISNKIVHKPQKYNQRPFLQKKIQKKVSTFATKLLFVYYLINFMFWFCIKFINWQTWSAICIDNAFINWLGRIPVLWLLIKWRTDCSVYLFILFIADHMLWRWCQITCLLNRNVYYLLFMLF